MLLAAAVLAAGAAVITVALVNRAHSSDSFTINGTIVVHDTDWLCNSDGGYGDIPHAQVVISDASGKTVAVGSVVSGIQRSYG